MAEGFMMGCVVSVYDVDEVMMALGITVAVVVEFEKKNSIMVCTGVQASLGK